MSWAWDVVLPLALKKFVHSFLDANWVCQAAADLISIFIMISTTTTVTRPSAAIIAKITNVEFVSIGSKCFKKYIIMIGEMLKDRHIIGILYYSWPFLVIFHRMQTEPILSK